MALNNTRWLHLSDFHVGKDEYGQRQLFKYILGEVRNRTESGEEPDIVFVTGDLANRGLDSEYETFINDFIYPLWDVLGDGWAGKLFIVPGNHDVDRSQSKAVQAHGVLSRLPHFLDPSAQGLSERTPLLSRFASYVTADLPNVGGKWLNAAEGCFTDIFDIRGTRIGVLGLNTAWLSENDSDRHNLSPGKGMIETGLESIQSCDLVIVLGHHPIDWFIDKEVKPIRALLAKKNVIYLHGHLHKNDSLREEGAGQLFLSLQAGASFQAREDEIWINRMIWCELDMESKQLIVQPLQWSRDNQEWSIDGSALPNRYRPTGADRWSFPLPSANGPDEPIVDSRRSNGTVLPDGWLLIDKGYLARHQVSLDDDRLIRYFDGRVPTWEDALSQAIPRRTIVTEFVSEISSIRPVSDLRVILLIGAGGEGKSTVLRQVVCDLVDLRPEVKILWHNNSYTKLPTEFITLAAQSGEQWLIVSDDADLIADSVFDLIVTLHEANRTNIEFLFTCRDTDWRGAKADQLPWEQYTSVFTKRIRGLSLKDAERITEAWSKYNDKGMGRLSGLEPKEAAKVLVQEADSEEYIEEGAFLGAMLRARIGEDIKSHVTALLLRLNERPSPGGTLMQAFCLHRSVAC